MARENVTVIIPEKPDKNAPLILNDKLSKVRKELEDKSTVNMDDTLLFVNKNSDSDVEKGEEEETQLNDVIERIEDKFYLHLKKMPLEKFLNFGRTITDENGFEVAIKEALNLKNNEITLEVFKEKENEIKLPLDGIKLLLTKDIVSIDVQKLKINRLNFATKPTYTVIEQRKASLNFSLRKLKESKLAVNFINDVKNVINSEYSDKKGKLKEIFIKYGRFISEKVILGGRAYFKNPNTWDKLRNRNSYFELKLVGGRKFNHEEFNESDWLKSLEDPRNWECFKVENQVSVFEILPKELYRQVSLLVGKKIICTRTEDHDYDKLLPDIKPYKKMYIPVGLKDILQNDDDNKYNIFAMVVDKKGVNNDIFNCQIFWPDRKNSGGRRDQKLIIYCIRRSTQLKCKLKVRFMITSDNIDFESDFHIDVKKEFINEVKFNSHNIKLELEDNGYCFGIPVLKNINDSLIIGHHFYEEGNKKGVFTFSYSERGERYDANLPDFTFCTLVIYNNDELLKFQDRKISKLSKLPNSTKELRFISLYSLKEKKTDFIFLRQRIDEIKIKYINFKHKHKLHEPHELKCAIFDPLPI